MGCFLQNLAFGTYTGTLPQAEVPSKTSDGGPYLMISDNPETISASTFDNQATSRLVLWHHEVSVSTSGSRHRVFGWHAAGGIPLKIGLTIASIGASPIRVINIRRCKNSGPSSNPLPVGRCLAEALLSNSGWDSFTPIESLDNIAAGTTRVIDAYSLNSGDMVGFLFEFDVVLVSGTTSSYKLRVVATRVISDGVNELRSITNPLAAIVGSHPRWGWTFANTRLSQSYNLTIPPGGMQTKLVTLNGGGEGQLVFSAANSYDSPNAVSNSGEYGAIFTIPIVFFNNDSVSRTIRVQIHRRGREAYYGAAQKDTGNFAIPSKCPRLRVFDGCNYCPRRNSLSHV